MKIVEIKPDLSKVDEQITENVADHLLTKDYMGKLKIKGNLSIQLSEDIVALSGLTSIKLEEVEAKVHVMGPNIRAKSKNNDEYKPLFCNDKKYMTKGVKEVFENG